MSFFDSAKTPKSTNPDSVSHANGVLNQKINHIGPHVVGNHAFFTSNWRPNSRPTIWKTTSFETIIGHLQPCPTFQMFEKHMYDSSDQFVMEGNSWTSGFIDHGVCKTFPQHTSSRLIEGYGSKKADPVVDLIRLNNMLAVTDNWT